MSQYVKGGHSKGGMKHLKGVKKVTSVGKGTCMIPRSTVTKSFMHNRRIP